MAITYIKTAERVEKWGIDVTVQFTNGIKFRTKTFGFKDQDELDNDFESRMIKAISNLTDETEREITPDEFVDKLRIYFKTNTTLTKTQVLEFFNEKVLVEGLL